VPSRWGARSVREAAATLPPKPCGATWAITCAALIANSSKNTPLMCSWKEFIRPIRRLGLDLVLGRGWGFSEDYLTTISNRFNRYVKSHPGTSLFPVFLPFPQGSPILHSFCTTEHQFSVVID